MVISARKIAPKEQDLMGSFFDELKRRNVFRVAIAYLVTAWLLLQVVDVVLGNIGAPEWFFKATLLFLGIGFPLAVLFAWAFELTPEGIKKEKDVDRSTSITHVTGKKLEYFTIAALSLIVVFFLTREFLPSTAEPLADESVAVEQALPSSIAVLPFEDFSEKADQGYFSRGIAEEILNLLAKTRGLQVAARTSSFAFAGSELDIREIGHKLGVETVLEGSIRKAGNAIRVTAQLINIKDGYHLWSDTYNRDFDDIFQIQDEIAAAILSSLKVHLLGEDEPVAKAERAHDLDAYSAYLIGKERMALRKREDIETARDKFSEAIEIDPAYAPPRVALAQAWLILERDEFDGEDIDEAAVDEVVDVQLQAALELSPDLPEAIAVRGLHHLQRFRYDEARRDFDRAIQLNPNYALAYLWRSETFYQQEQYLDMLADKEKAYALDPMSLEISSQLAFDYGSFWRPRDADRIIARMFQLHPGHPRAYRALAANLSNHGRNAEATLVLEQALEEHPENEMFREWHAWSLLTMGLYEEAEAQDVDTVSFWILLDQGRVEKARDLLQKGFSEDLSGDWLEASLGYRRDMRSELGLQPFKSSVAQNLAYLDEKNIPWKEQCRPYLMFDMRESGLTEGMAEMMEKCRKRTEERLKAQYLCPCSWFNLVLFATLDGRTDEAIERAQEWLNNGDSFAMLHTDPIVKTWADRPEYEEILARNAQQVERQQQLYLAGVAARGAKSRDAAAAESAGPGRR
jgi:TolB-like protein/Tfp pilus assembly protein PilF